jgi:hypothetical protein
VQDAIMLQKHVTFIVQNHSLRDEKEEQAKAIETKFDVLNQRLEELQKPQAPW